MTKRDKPTFSLSPAESEAESGCESPRLSSDASSSGYDSDINAAVPPFPVAVRVDTVESDRTIVQNAKKRQSDVKDDREDLLDAVKENDKGRIEPHKEPSEVQNKIASSESTAPKLTAERPKPTKHISWTSMLHPNHYKKQPTTTDSSDNTAAGSGTVSPQSRSANTSSSSLASMGDRKALGAHHRSHSARSLKGLSEGLSHFSLVEKDPRKMQSVDATLANEMVFGG